MIHIYDLLYCDPRPSNPDRPETFIFKASSLALESTEPQVKWLAGLKRSERDLHLVPNLGMCGALPLLPQRAFMAWTGKILLFIVMPSVGYIL